jgi:NDP-sugar pyrophosphorylase family protein
VQCLVLAGGLGTRMRPLTETVPKALLPVAGRPFAEWQLDWLASEGVDRVVYSVGYLGEAIEGHIGDGRRWGMSVRYIHEGGRLLGTAGAIRLAADLDALDDAFFVLYGDSYISVDLRDVERRFRSCGLPALMTVYRNDGRWAESNVEYRDGMVVLYDKFATDRRGMHHIDYGVLALTRALIEKEVEAGSAADLAPLMTQLSRSGRVAGFEATERFFEIGSREGLHQLEEHLRGKERSVP